MDVIREVRNRVFAHAASIQVQQQQYEQILKKLSIAKNGLFHLLAVSQQYLDKDLLLKVDGALADIMSTAQFIFIFIECCKFTGF